MLHSIVSFMCEQTLFYNIGWEEEEDDEEEDLHLFL